MSFDWRASDFNGGYSFWAVHNPKRALTYARGEFFCPCPGAQGECPSYSITSSASASSKGGKNRSIALGDDGVFRSRIGIDSAVVTSGPSAIASFQRRDGPHPGDESVEIGVRHLGEIFLARHRRLELAAVAPDAL